MKKNKGFTLVELLAVIVILAVIALIATPVVLSMIESSRKGAAESSMLSYVDATEKSIVTSLMSNSSSVNYDQTYTLDSAKALTLNAKGGTKACIKDSVSPAAATASDLADVDTSTKKCAAGFKTNPAFNAATNGPVSVTIDVKGDQPDATAADSVVVVEGNVVKEAKLKFGKYYVSYFYDKAKGSSVYCSSDSEFPANEAACK